MALGLNGLRLCDNAVMSGLRSIQNLSPWRMWARNAASGLYYVPSAKMVRFAPTSSLSQ